jgi:hypothetical protein
MHEEVIFTSKSFDVKNMYTELPHDKIIEAVDWLLSEACSTKYGRRRVVHCRRTGRNGVEFQTSGGYTSITFAQLRAFVLFDLHNVFFTLGKTILHQIFGIPMGSPTSPALAIIVCARAEHIFMSSILDYRWFFASRYMDDIHLAMLRLAADSAAAERVEDTLNKFLSLYPSSLTLEQTSSGTVPFLETVVHYPSQPVSLSTAFSPSSTSLSFSLKYFLKNTSSLTMSPLKFSRLQHGSSFRSPSHVAGSLVGSFLRIRTFSSTPLLSFLASLEFLCELHTLSYNPRTVLKSLRILENRHPYFLWSLLKKVIASPDYHQTMSSLQSILPDVSY